MDRARFIDRLQAAIGNSNSVGDAQIEGAMQALPEQPTPFELIVVKDAVCRRLARLGAGRACSDCAVMPGLLALLEANNDSARFRAAVARWCREGEVASREVHRHPAVAKALRFIAGHFADADLTLAAVAAAVGVSRWHVDRLLVAHTQIGFRAHLHRVRVGNARYHLADVSLPVKEVAFLVGYRSTSQLDRHFRAIVGQTPVAYRNGLKRGRARSGNGSHKRRSDSR